MSEHKQTNRLSREKSPYLLQHAHNPVDWYPWSDEAFEKATRENKPVFLSIGYSCCHWCHVMERESFEDQDVAEILNRNYVAVKVDREERPDIDHIYMSVCQALTGHGGWPLTIVMAPDKKPFFAGTYFPRDDRSGMPGLVTVLGKISEAWTDRREDLLSSGEKITDVIKQREIPPGEIDASSLIERALSDFKGDFDSRYGGFGNAPKFPSPHNLYFLLRYWHLTKDTSVLDMVEKTLAAMYRGGIFDHIGFGFSRYSTDRKWLVPHFEKMLYDNALLAIAYLEAYQATRKKDWGMVARKIFGYLLRDMVSPEGGFYSAEDADSEGVEGKFYIWTVQEVSQVLGEDAGQRFCSMYDITRKGNFEGSSIPNLIKIVETDRISDLGKDRTNTVDVYVSNIGDGGADTDFIEECKSKLFQHREKRVHPFKDDKILASWNGLAIAALAIGGRILEEQKFTDAAVKAVEFINSKLTRKDGHLLASYRDGKASIPGYAEDYSFLIWGLIELYETTYKPEYLKMAINLNSELLRLFWDETAGGLFIYGSDSEQLIARPKEAYDGAAPSSNSVSALNFIRLARLTGRHDLEDKAQQLFKAFGGEVARFPRGYAHMLSAMMFLQAKSGEVIVVGDETAAGTRELLDIIKARYMPFTVSMLVTGENTLLSSLVPSTENYTSVEGKPAAYVCRNFACSYPVTESRDLSDLLQ